MLLIAEYEGEIARELKFPSRVKLQNGMSSNAKRRRWVAKLFVIEGKIGR
jgi:hypothetical protein